MNPTPAIAFAIFGAIAENGVMSDSTTLAIG